MKLAARLTIVFVLCGAAIAQAQEDAKPTWRRIQAALNEETTIDATEMPLREVAAHFEALHRIPIQIDLASLADEGVDDDLPITRVSAGRPLRATLDAIARDFALGHVVENDRLLITTKAKAKERRIEAALEQPTEVDFVEVPLREAVEFLEELHKIPIEIDTSVLSEGGLGGKILITRTLKGITLASLLNLILGELELTYIIENEVLLITSLEFAQSRPTIKLYPVGGFLDEGWDIESLKRVVKMHTAGECELLGRHLAIHQSQPSHRKTDRLMRELAAAARNER